MRIFNLGTLQGVALMWANRKLLVVGVTGLIAYTLLIQVGTDHCRDDPYYPLSCWNLLSGTLGKVTRFEIEIVELEGRLLRPPSPITKLGKLQWSAGDPQGLRNLLSAWGSAIETAKTSRSESLRRIFENSYLPSGKIKYQLVRLQYVPVARLSSSSPEERLVIGEYRRN